MGDVTTRKFVGDASLNNNSFIHCVIYWLSQISIMGQICSFHCTRKNKKAFSFREASPPDSPPGALPPGPRWGFRSQTPVIGSRSALAIEFELCAVLNWSSKKPWVMDRSLCELEYESGSQKPKVPGLQPPLPACDRRIGRLVAKSRFSS